jgi:hypothetical protein
LFCRLHLGTLRVRQGREGVLRESRLSLLVEEEFFEGAPCARLSSFASM